MARPTRPEPKVFLSDEIKTRGLGWYRATYFAHASSEQLLGEKSTSYLEVPHSAARAAAVLGRAEIVAQLRDPVARAVSNWRLSSAHGLEDRPLAAALEDNLLASRAWDPALTSVSPYAYLERGHYVKHLEPWFCAFPGAVHVRFLEELATPSSIGSLYAELAVDADHGPQPTQQALNRSEGTAPPLGTELRKRLRAHFRDSDQRLQELLGRTLPWTREDLSSLDAGG